jgi:hypothetical protein
MDILQQVQENKARRVADRLREIGIDARLARAGLDRFGVSVKLPGGRDAQWSTDGTAGLGAQVLRNGNLVGFVPKIEGSENFGEDQVIDAIARADYEQPVGRLRAEAPPAGPPLPPEGGLFRRFLDGFRY